MEGREGRQEWIRQVTLRIEGWRGGWASTVESSQKGPQKERNPAVGEDPRI